MIAALVLHYGGAPMKGGIFLSVYCAIVSVLVSGYTSTDILWTMQAVTVPIILIAKVSSITLIKLCTSKNVILL